MGGTDRYARIPANERYSLHFLLYHYHIGNLLLVSHPNHFTPKECGRNERGFTHNITHELKTPIAVAYAANDAMLNFKGAENPEKDTLICKSSKHNSSNSVAWWNRFCP